MQFEKNEIIEIETWQDYVNEVRDDFGVWIFRAHNLDKIESMHINEKCIKSSFDKACERAQEPILEKDRWKYEARMLFEFKRGAHRYLDNIPPKEDFLEWFSIARHYGMPSRLVDFTYSPYVAAYFALSTKNDEEAGCIIALNLRWLKNDIEKRINTEWKKKMRPISIKDASFHNTKFFHKFAFDWEESCVVPVNPLTRNSRLASQQGLFLCPGNIDKSFDYNLKKTLEKEKFVKKIFILKSKIRRDAIRELWKMNINLATLYQDLSGWAETQRDLVHFKIEDKRVNCELKNSIQKPSI